MIFFKDDHIGNLLVHYKNQSTQAKLDEHVASIPRLADDLLDEQVFAYYNCDRKRTIFDPKNNICIKLNSVKFAPIIIRQLKKLQCSDTEMIDLLEYGYIYPFLLFINGRFIPWERIRIMCSHGYNYLYIHDLFLDFAKKVRTVETMHLMIMPSNMVYSMEVNADDEYQTLFSFNLQGEYDTENWYHKIYYHNPGNHTNIYTTNDVVTNSEIVKVADNAQYKVFQENYWFFDENGLLVDGKVDPLGGKMKVTLPDGIEIATMIGILDNKVTPTLDNIAQTNYSVIEKDIDLYLTDPDNAPDYMKDLAVPFDLEMTTTKSYTQNRQDAIDYILNYRTDLFYILYDLKVKFFTLTVDYNWLMCHRDPVGYLSIPRKWRKSKDYFIMVMVNGELYKYYKHHFYKANYLKCPITAIEENDNIELLFFRNIDQYEIHSTVTTKGEPLSLDEGYCNDNTMIYCKETHLDYFKYPEDGNQHFPVGFTIEKVDTGNRIRTKINYDNDFYYGKDVVFAPRDTFKYYGMYIDEMEAQYFKLNLGHTFDYCYDYNRYMVFYNGRRLSNDQYRLTVPCRPTTPFFEFEIYLTVPLVTHDRIDIFYLPSEIRDIDVEFDIDDNGKIIVNEEYLPYMMSTKNYTFWINGRKIPVSEMKQISSSTIQLNKDIDSILHCKITRMTTAIDEIENRYDKDKESLWDKSIREYGDHNEILGTHSVNVDNIEDDFYLNNLPIQSIMWELIRDHYMANGLVDITGAFLYDYLDQDNTVFDGIDQAGNSIIDAMNSERFDNIDQVIRYYP